MTKPAESAETSTDSQTSALPDPARLRVAIFSDSFPERNGAGAYYYDLAKQLAPELEKLVVFQPVVKKRLLMKFALPLPGDSTQKVITPNAVRIRREFKELNPHLVIAVTPGPFGLLGLYLARRAKTGFITAFHTHFEGLVQLYGDTLFFRTANWYLEQVNKILIKPSATVLINNDSLIPTVKNLGARKTDLMGTPLSSAFLEDPVVPPAPKLEQILFAGRLAPEKNLEVVIEAVRQLPHIRFVMAGDGPLRKKMAAVAAECPNLRLTGWLDRESLRKEMDACSLLILPSHMETFGTVALEAMARGRPALVAESAGIHQWTVLKDALISFRLHDSMPHTLARIAEYPAEYWQAKALAARKAAEQLNRETIVQWVGFVRQYAQVDR